MSRSRLRKTNRGGANTVMIVAALLVVGAGIFAYKVIFHRAGEEAISLLPSDSLVVATADLGPSPGQVELFAHIAKKMIDEKVDDPLESVASASTNGAAFLKSIRPYLGLSYAFGGWKKPNAAKDDDLTFVGLAAIKSTSDVETAAAQHGVLAQMNGLSYYRINGEKTCVATIKQYLVASDDPAALLRVQAIANGEVPSVASLHDYVDARSRLPKDANLMVFVNMTAVYEIAKAQIKGDVSNAAAPKGWMGGAATVRNTGIEFVWNAPVDMSNPASHLVASIKPIDSGLYNRVPAGAFGLLSLAQPGAYYALKDQNLGFTADQKKQLQDGIDSFEKETGLNIERDLITGLNGNLTLAVYPSNGASTETAIPDGLIMLDDANGSDPAAMVEKIKGVIADECKKNHSAAPTYRSEQQNGAVIWTLDDATEKALRTQTGVESKPADTSGVSAGINGVDVSSQGTNVHIGQSGVKVSANGTNIAVASNGVHVDRSEKQPEAKPDQKMLIFTVINKSVIIASSRSLIDRAISSYTSGKSSLATDPAFMPMLKQITAGSQQVLMIGVPDIMERLRHTLTDSMNGPTDPKPDDIIKMFGPQGNGLLFSQGCTDNRASGILYLPLDYDRVIHLIGSLKNTRKGALQ